MNAVLRKFLTVSKARTGSALAGQVVWPLAGRRSLDTSACCCLVDVVATGNDCVKEPHFYTFATSCC
jgi:hypothetical protein